VGVFGKTSLACFIPVLGLLIRFLNGKWKDSQGIMHRCYKMSRKIYIIPTLMCSKAF